MRSLYYRRSESTTAPDYSSVWWGRRSFTIKYNLCQLIEYPIIYIPTTSRVSRPFASLASWVLLPPSAWPLKVHAVCLRILPCLRPSYASPGIWHQLPGRSARQREAEAKWEPVGATVALGSILLFIGVHLTLWGSSYVLFDYGCKPALEFKVDNTSEGILPKIQGSKKTCFILRWIQ